MDLMRMNSTLMRNILGETAVRSGAIIRPVQLEDVDLILAMHRRLSNDSLYKRYQLTRRPSRQEIEQVVGLEGENGRVLVAAIPGSEQKVVGLAYFVVTGEGTAETAFLVEDAYQGQGLGKRLMQALVRAGKADGICFFDAYVLSSNRPMIHLLMKSGRLIQKKPDYGSVEMRFDICPI